MPFHLGAKDIVGPAVSLLGAGLSGLLFILNSKANTRAANRAIYVEGQKFVLEICKQLMADPLLWSFYDDESFPEESAASVNTSAFQGKLRAFAHLHLNMFEIVFNEIPPPAPTGKNRNPSNVWYDYFHDTLSRSHVARAVLAEPASNQIWGAKMMDEYRDWTRQADAKAAAAKGA